MVLIALVAFLGAFLGGLTEDLLKGRLLAEEVVRSPRDGF